MIPLRLYAKPELCVEVFDVDDVITVSAGHAPGGYGDDHEQINFLAAPVFGDSADQVEKPTVFPQSTVADPSGAFQQQVTGGNIIQEGLNNLYENFLNRF